MSRSTDLVSRVALIVFVLASAVIVAQDRRRNPTDLDSFMAQALQRREVDRKTLGDYVLDEVETFEILGPGGAPINRFKREYTWYVRDGIHVRSPLKYDGVPISRVGSPCLRGAVDPQRERAAEASHRARGRARERRQGTGLDPPSGE